MEEVTIEKTFEERVEEAMAMTDNPKVKELIRQFEEAKESYNKDVDTFNNSFYVLDGGLYVANKLYEFITKKSQWKFTECIYITEITKRLEEQIVAIENKEKENVEIKSMDLDAFHFFFNKHEGVGYLEAEQFITLYNEVYVKILAAMKETQRSKDGFKKQEQDLQNLAYKIQAAEQGLDEEAPLSSPEDYVNEASTVSSDTAPGTADTNVYPINNE